VALQAVYDYAEIAWTVASSVRHALADLELSGLEAERLRALVETRDEQLRLLRRRIELGAAARPELGRREAEEVAERRRLDDAERRQTAARARLAAALGLPAAALADVRLAGDASADPPLPAAAELDAWRDQALLSRADVRRAVADYDLAEQALRIEVARQYPEVRLGPGYVWERGVVKLPFDLSLTLPWPGGNRAAIAAAEARRAEAGRHLEAVQAAVLGEIESAEAERARSLAALASARGESLAVARQLEARSGAAFAAGALDRLEWLDARLGREAAELAALDALRSAREATLALEDALRRPLAGAELELARPLESVPPQGEEP
jgi:CRISPR system Cascade subunit CasA